MISIRIDGTSHFNLVLVTHGVANPPSLEFFAHAVKTTAFVFLAALLAGCATPGTQRIEVSDQATKAEAARQLELAAQDMFEEQKRISRVYRALATKASSLCGEQVGPNTGVFSMTKPKGDIGSVFEKQYGVGAERTILFVLEGSPADVSGLKPRDIIKKINGVASSDAAALAELNEKISPEDPIVYEIHRSRTPLSITVKPEKACRYSILLDMQQIVNAFADGKRIGVTRGMVNFTKDDNELALVISHELAHNIMKHIDAKKQNMGLGILADIAVLLASRGQVGNTNFGQLGAGAFSQEFEAEADYVGLYLMANAGMPIADAPKFWRRMAAANPANIKTNHSASHPSTSYRMVALEETVKEIGAKREKKEPLVPNMKDGKFTAPTK